MKDLAIYSQTSDYYDLALLAIDRSELEDSTKSKYSGAVRLARAAGVPLSQPERVHAYASKLSGSGRAFLRGALRLMSRELEMLAKAQATPENIDIIQAGLYRLEALNVSVPSVKQRGVKAHKWLSAKELTMLLKACGKRKSGKPENGLLAQRDRLAIGLLAVAGLRREEAVNLRFEDIVVNNGRTLLNVKGKGSKNRSVPIKAELAQAIETWSLTIGERTGFILRTVGRDRQVKDSMTGQALYYMLEKRGEIAGIPELRPHSLRRTFAQLARTAGVPLEELSVLLGHEDLKTTMIYLNVKVETSEGMTASDYIPF